MATCHPPFFRPPGFCKSVKCPEKRVGRKKRQSYPRGTRGNCKQNFRGRSGHFGHRPQTLPQNDLRRLAHRGRRHNGRVRASRPRGSWSIGPESDRRKIGRSAENAAVGRKRPRQRGQHAGRCVATAVLARNAPIGRNAKTAMLGALKPKSPHSTWTCEQAYISTHIRQMNVSLRSGLRPCWQARFDG